MPTFPTNDPIRSLLRQLTTQGFNRIRELAEQGKNLGTVIDEYTGSALAKRAQELNRNLNEIPAIAFQSVQNELHSALQNRIQVAIREQNRLSREAARRLREERAQPMGASPTPRPGEPEIAHKMLNDRGEVLSYGELLEVEIPDNVYTMHNNRPILLRDFLNLKDNKILSRKINNGDFESKSEHEHILESLRRNVGIENAGLNIGYSRDLKNAISKASTSITNPNLGHRNLTAVQRSGIIADYNLRGNSPIEIESLTGNVINSLSTAIPEDISPMKIKGLSGIIDITSGATLQVTPNGTLSMIQSWGTQMKATDIDGDRLMSAVHIVRDKQSGEIVKILVNNEKYPLTSIKGFVELKLTPEASTWVSKKLGVQPSAIPKDAIDFGNYTIAPRTVAPGFNDLLGSVGSNYKKLMTGAPESELLSLISKRGEVAQVGIASNLASNLDFAIRRYFVTIGGYTETQADAMLKIMGLHSMSYARLLNLESLLKAKNGAFFNAYLNSDLRAEGIGAQLGNSTAVKDLGKETKEVFNILMSFREGANFSEFDQLVNNAAGRMGSMTVEHAEPTGIKKLQLELDAEYSKKAPDQRRISNIIKQIKRLEDRKIISPRKKYDASSGKFINVENSQQSHEADTIIGSLFGSNIVYDPETGDFRPILELQNLNIKPLSEKAPTRSALLIQRKIRERDEKGQQRFLSRFENKTQREFNERLFRVRTIQVTDPRTGRKGLLGNITGQGESPHAVVAGDVARSESHLLVQSLLDMSAADEGSLIQDPLDVIRFMLETDEDLRRQFTVDAGSGNTRFLGELKGDFASAKAIAKNRGTIRQELATISGRTTGEIASLARQAELVGPTGAAAKKELQAYLLQLDFSRNPRLQRAVTQLTTKIEGTVGLKVETTRQINGKQISSSVSVNPLALETASERIGHFTGVKSSAETEYGDSVAKRMLPSILAHDIVPGTSKPQGGLGEGSLSNTAFGVSTIGKRVTLPDGTEVLVPASKPDLVLDPFRGVKVASSLGNSANFEGNYMLVMPDLNDPLHKNLKEMTEGGLFVNPPGDMLVPDGPGSNIFEQANSGIRKVKTVVGENDFRNLKNKPGRYFKNNGKEIEGDFIYPWTFETMVDGKRTTVTKYGRHPMPELRKIISLSNNMRVIGHNNNLDLVSSDGTEVDFLLGGTEAMSKGYGPANVRKLIEQAKEDKIPAQQLHIHSGEEGLKILESIRWDKENPRFIEGMRKITLFMDSMVTEAKAQMMTEHGMKTVTVKGILVKRAKLAVSLGTDTSESTVELGDTFAHNAQTANMMTSYVAKLAKKAKDDKLMIDGKEADLNELVEYFDAAGRAAMEGSRMSFTERRVAAQNLRISQATFSNHPLMDPSAASTIEGIINRLEDPDFTGIAPEATDPQNKLLEKTRLLMRPFHSSDNSASLDPTDLDRRGALTGIEALHEINVTGGNSALGRSNPEVAAFNRRKINEVMALEALERAEVYGAMPKLIDSWSEEEKNRAKTNMDFHNLPSVEKPKIAPQGDNNRKPPPDVPKTFSAKPPSNYTDDDFANDFNPADIPKDLFDDDFSNDFNPADIPKDLFDDDFSTPPPRPSPKIDSSLSDLKYKINDHKRGKPGINSAIINGHVENVKEEFLYDGEMPEGGKLIGQDLIDALSMFSDRLGVELSLEKGHPSRPIAKDLIELLEQSLKKDL